MANEHNLRPSEYKLSLEEAKRGGIASGKARRERKELKSACAILASMLEQPLKNADAKTALKGVGIENPTHLDGIMYRVLAKAQKGDLKAVELLLKLAGKDEDREHLTGQKIDVTTNGKDIVAEPIVVEVIDKREQVKTEE